MKETIESIAQWAHETFGPSSSERTIIRSIEEASELCTHLAKGETIEAAQEAVDVFIVMCRYYVLHKASAETVLRDPLFMGPRSPMDSAAVLVKLLGSSLLGEKHPGAFPDSPLATITIIRRLLLDLGVDFDELVDTKMDINRKREWKRDGTGCGQHVEAASA